MSYNCNPWSCVKPRMWLHHASYFSLFWFLISVTNMRMRQYLLFCVFLKLLSVSPADLEDSVLTGPDSKIFYPANIFNITGDNNGIGFGNQFVWKYFKLRIGLKLCRGPHRDLWVHRQGICRRRVSRHYRNLYNLHH